LGLRPNLPHIGGRPWTVNELRLLGTMPDDELAVAHAPPQGTAARLLDRVFAFPEGKGLWDRSADLEESGPLLNMVATT
jgi:hypothetical protein